MRKRDKVEATCTWLHLVQGHIFRINFDRRGNFRGAAILLFAEILPGAEISTSALVLSYIIMRMNFVYPQKFSAANFRLSFPPEF
jgi:hypothetical protein